MGDYAALLESMMRALLTGDAAAAAGLYKDKADFSPGEQFAVYLHGYRSRLQKILGNLYLATRYYLGEEKFAAAAGAFIESTPSRHYNIDTYALGFAAYIRETGKGSDPFLAEMACLESTSREVYHLPETRPLDNAWLKQQTPERLTDTNLALRAASRLMDFSYPVSEYIRAFRAGGNPRKPEPEPGWVLVLRDGDELLHLPLAQAEHALLHLIAEGHTLGAALASERFAAFAADENLGSNFQKWFTRWIDEGFLS